jgi:hypothetical protein
MPHLIQPGAGEHSTHRSAAGLSNQTDNHPNERRECRCGKARASDAMPGLWIPTPPTSWLISPRSPSAPRAASINSLPALTPPLQPHRDRHRSPPQAPRSLARPAMRRAPGDGRSAAGHLIGTPVASLLSPAACRIWAGCSSSRKARSLSTLRLAESSYCACDHDQRVGFQNAVPAAEQR